MGHPVGADHEGADRDGGVDRSREVEVADHPGVRATLHRFEGVDDLHGPDLRRTRDRARRKRGAQDVDGAATLGEIARYLRGEVHHMAVPLEHHRLIELLGAEANHSAHIVAGEVDEHHVLGDLLGVLAQFGAEASILLVGAAAPTSAGDGTRDDATVDQLDHRLGRGAGEAERLGADEVHVRAGIDLTEHPVEIERIGIEVEGEPLREHDLEDVAGEDVLLRDVDRSRVLGRGHRSAHLGQLRIGHGRVDHRFVEWTRTIGGQLREPLDRVVVEAVERGDIGALGDQHVVDERDALTEVVEGGQLTDDRHDGIGVAGDIGRGVGQMFDLSHHVVAEIADDATVQGRELIEHG